MQTAEDFLMRTTTKWGFKTRKAFDGDYDLEPFPNAKAINTIRLLEELTRYEFKFFFPGDVIHIHAPHRKQHNWFDRGWECPFGLTVYGCEEMRKRPEPPEAVALKKQKVLLDNISSENLREPDR